MDLSFADYSSLISHHHYTKYIYIDIAHEETSLFFAREQVSHTHVSVATIIAIVLAKYRPSTTLFPRPHTLEELKVLEFGNDPQQ